MLGVNSKKAESVGVGGVECVRQRERETEGECKCWVYPDDHRQMLHKTISASHSVLCSVFL